MSKNQRQTPRKPATKFAHLQKKMQKQKVKARSQSRIQAEPPPRPSGNEATNSDGIGSKKSRKKQPCTVSDGLWSPSVC